MRRELIQGGIGIALIQGCGLILSISVAIVLARTIGANGYGIYAFAMAVMSLLMVLAQLGMPTLIIREVAASESRGDWGLLRGVLARVVQIVFLASIGFSSLAALWLLLMKAGIPSSKFNTMALTFLLTPILALSNVGSAALRGLRHVVLGQAVETLPRAGMLLVGLVVVFVLYPDMRLPETAMGIQVVAALLSLVLTVILLQRHIPQAAKSVRPAYRTRVWLGSAMPLTLLTGAGFINQQTDVLMIGIFRPAEDVGVYRVAVQGSTLVAFGLHAANAVIAPQFARLYALGDRDALQRLATMSARLILLSALPVTLVFVLAGGAIAAWVFGPEFDRSHVPLAVLALSQLVNAGMGSVGFLLNMTGNESDAARAMGISALLNVVLNLLLIPPLGITGAAIATSISLIGLNILLYRSVRQRIGIHPAALVPGPS